MDGPFRRQAAVLRIAFYYVQITIHRPFIQLAPSSRRVSPLSLPSLAICANAARSTSHILEACIELTAPAMVVMVAFISGLVLMISIWEARRSGLNVDVSTQVADVHRCLKYLRKWESTIHLAGRLYDILRETASVSEVIPPSNGPTPPDTTSPTTAGANNTNGYSHIRKHRRENDMSGASGFSDQTSSYSPSLFNVSSPSTSQSYPTSPMSPPQYQQLPSTGASSHVMPQSTYVPMANTMGNNTNNSLNNAAPPSVPMFTPSYPTTLDDNWENYHIAGSTIPAMGMGLQRMPGVGVPALNGAIDPMSPNSFLHDLLGPLEGNASGMQQEYWNNQPLAQWNWMTDVPGAFGVPATAPSHNQQ